MSDEQRRDSCGVYGNEIINTPNIDALAQSGATFKNAYCNSPLCVPSRSSMVTGQYVNQIKSWGNNMPWHGNVTSWNQILQENDYQTISIGKLHFRSTKDNNGFDEEIIPMHIYNEIGDPLGLIRDEIPQIKKFRSYIDDAGPGESSYTSYDTMICSEAIEWIKTKGVKSGKPWFLYTGFVAPHPPYIAPSKFYDIYSSKDFSLYKHTNKTKLSNHPIVNDFRYHLNLEDDFSPAAINNAIAAYYGLVSFLDFNIGQLLDALSETGLKENTYILFCSDHGECMGQRGLWAKSVLYEESVGIPLILTGPDIKNKQTCKTPVSLIDIFPTVLEISNVQPAKKTAINKDSISLLKLLDEDYDSDRKVFSEYHAVGSPTSSFMIRKGEWKYIHYNLYEDELYNLKKDPFELDNKFMQPDHQDISQELWADLLKICDPKLVFDQAIKDAGQLLERLGGKKTLFEQESFGATPPPGI